MKNFKFYFIYKGKEYEGELQSPHPLDSYGGENERTLMRMIANKFGFDSDFANSSRSKFSVKVYEM